MNRAYARKANRPTLDEALALLASRGWTPSAASWEGEHTVYAFSQESYPGTYGGAAATVQWSGASGFLSVPEVKPVGVKFV